MNRSPVPRKKERGFSLIETMIAAFLFTVGALGLLGLMVASSRGSSVAERVTQATVLARDKLQELTRTPYANVTTGNEATNLDATGEVAGVFGSNQDSDGNFARSWTVTEPDAGVDFKLIVVRVAWADKATHDEREVVVTGGVSAQ